jgi:hypothetical protein
MPAMACNEHQTLAGQQGTENRPQRHEIGEATDRPGNGRATISILKMMKARVLQSKLPKLGSELSDNSQQLGRLAVLAVLRIRDVYPRIPDLNFFHPGSRIHIKEFKYFQPEKLF